MNGEGTLYYQRERERERERERDSNDITMDGLPLPCRLRDMA